MNKYVDKIFKNKKADGAKLQKYGFTEEGETYRYACGILDNQFKLAIEICGEDITTKVTDSLTNDEYTLFLSDDAAGSFVGAVRTAYEKELSHVAEKCFDKCVFKSAYAQKIISYAKRTYGGGLEFLWEKFDENAVLRRQDNGKWYAALLTVSKRKLGLDTDEKAEIIDLRANPEFIERTADNVRFFRGYHMNKKHWITVCLDGTVPIDEIIRMLDISYDLAKKK